MKKTDGHLRAPGVIDIVGTRADRRVRAHFLFLPGPFLPSFPFATLRSIRPSVPLSLISQELLARPNATRVAQSMCSRVGGLFVYGEKRDRVPIFVNRAKNYEPRPSRHNRDCFVVQRRRWYVNSTAVNSSTATRLHRPESTLDLRVSTAISECETVIWAA
jgi:hypothetical protein